MLGPAVIVSAVRTPLGVEGGPLSTIPSPELGAMALRAAVGRARLRPEQVDTVMLDGGPLEGHAFTQTVARLAGLPGDREGVAERVPQASGEAALQRALNRLALAPASVILLGGLTASQPADLDPPGVPELGAERTPARDRAWGAIGAGAFTWELVPVAVPGMELITSDAVPAPGQGMAPTAAVLGIMAPGTAETLGLRPLATLRGAVSEAPGAGRVAAVVGNLLSQAGWTAARVDGWEMDDAHAESLQALALNPARVNIYGGDRVWGACGVGRLVTLLGTLRKGGGLRGVAVMGGRSGPVLALALEIEGGVACGGRLV